MTAWTALVPLKLADPKTRLAGLLSGEERRLLMERLTRHVIGVLSKCEAVDRIVVMSSQRPDWCDGEWRDDFGVPLNDALGTFRTDFGSDPLVVIHADLPMLTHFDLAELFDAARRHGAAFATDRAGKGTNALALGDGREFSFRFGPGSCALHRAQDRAMPVIERIGLAADLDTPEDLGFLRSRGHFSAFSCPSEG